MIKRPELIPRQISGDLRRGGWIVSGQVQGDTDAVSRALNLPLRGLNLTNSIDPSLITVIDGHVISDPSYSFSRHSSESPYAMGTVDNFLQGEALQDISFAKVASPTNSHEQTSWNFGEVVEHILQHHTSYIFDATGAAGSPTGVVLNTDIDTTNSTEFEVFIVRKSSNLWRTLQTIGGGEEGGGEFYRIYVNKKNEIIYKQAPPFISPQPAAIGTLTKEHLRGTIRVQLHNTDPGERVGQVDITTLKNATTVYNSKYPANPSEGKIVRKTRGIWAQSQARSDTLAERLYRWLTRSYTLQVPVDPSLVLFGDDGDGLDIADRILMTYDGPTEDASTGAGVHLNLSAQSLFVYGITVSYDPDGRVGQALLTLEHDNS